MKEKFSSYRAFMDDHKANGRATLMGIHLWSDPSLFTTDVRRMIQDNARNHASGRGFEGYDRSHRFAGSTAPPPKALAPVHLPGKTIRGDHAKKKIASHLPDMEKAFRAKQSKGRAGTFIVLNYCRVGSKFGRYYFVLCTSDGAAPSLGARSGWAPTGDHEVIVWNWADTEDLRLREDLVALLG
jgi:hypothetical protein